MHGFGKEMVTYISIGFGNPFGDPYSEDIVADFVEQVAELDCTKISLADTVGARTLTSSVDSFRDSFPRIPPSSLVPTFTIQLNGDEKIRAALDAGCRRFDGAIGGMGGCPFAASA